MPDAVSKRKAHPLPVPAKGEDAAERKRVLNVLAQRRYRQRRREHVKRLEEAHTDITSPVQSSTSTSAGTAHFESLASAHTSQLPLAPAPPAAAENDTVLPSDLQAPTCRPAELEFDDPFAVFDPDFVTAVPEDWDSLLPSLPGSPFSASDSTSDPNSRALSLTSFSSPGTSKLSNTPCTFPDEANFGILELDLMRAAIAIASRLNITNHVWSLTATSPFTDPSMALARFDHLPPNLRPTKIQMTHAHHPLIDLLPWPTVREKLILIFSQPVETRPPVAASPTALIELVYDIEDSAEGVRVWGDDPYSDQSWEVGEKLFSNWWWALDTDVIRRSNAMRRSRGARLLGEGTILGEVG